ncbi:MAG: hypothetical protein AAFR61_12305 [Bacteroidota bacterium]
MMAEQESHIYRQVLAYWEGTASPEARQALESRLETDADFRAEVLSWAESVALTEAYGDRYLKQQFSTLHLEMLSQQGMKSLNRRLWIGVAAAVVVLLVFVFLRPRPSAYLAHYSPYPMEDVRDASKEAWRQAYHEEHYGPALTKLTAVKDSLLTYGESESLFYGGMAAMEEKAFPQAQFFFQSVADSSYYYEKAQWYLSLAFFAQENQGEMIPIIEKIRQSPDHPYQKDAEELWQEIQASQQD